MNEDGTPIEDGEEAVAQKSGAANTGGSGEASASELAEVEKLYKDLGIKAKVPTGKNAGRPKSSTVRTKDAEEDGAGSAAAGSAKDNDDKDKSKNAPAANKDGDAGNTADAESEKKRKDSAEVSDESKEADAGVRTNKSTGEGDSERGSKEGAKPGDDGAGQAEDESDSSEEEGKRPGKSNPKVEQRFQKLTNDVREKEAAIAQQNDRIKELEDQLRETSRKQAEEKIAQEDPEYTVDDFRKVRDREGVIHDLDSDQAELAYRRWKDGYDQRAEQRNAEINRQEALQKAQAETEERMMRESVEAYDTLASLMDEFPELVEGESYDSDFAAKVMPLINESIVYAEGFEPGNEAGNQAIIAGLKINPKLILSTMKNIRDEKRSLPLNGVNDTVETRSNVNVPHSRSSDPTINAANELYKSLNIDKRF